MKCCRWRLMPPVPDHYVAQTNWPRLICQLLYNRGLTKPSQLELFIKADQRLSGDPLMLPDMQPAVIRIYRAILAGENIAVYGDYDVDGITVTAILLRGLKELGGRVIPYIPHRLTEGHGLNITALKQLRQQGVSLVITVDCGVTDTIEVRKANKIGLDIIITDHHTPLTVMPEALAIVNPKRQDSLYPFSELAGAGVAYKLLQALYLHNGREKPVEEVADMVALGTIADVAPLLGENRYLVKRGLEQINSTPRPGIEEIIEKTHLKRGYLDAENLSWVIVPRLNAAGRLDHAINSYKLLMTDLPEEAREISSWLEEKNSERQRLTKRILNHAREQVLTKGIGPILIASDSSYHAGIAGLAAGRLNEEFYRPAVLIRTGMQSSSGSCRSIPEFNIILVLNQCRHLLSRFGGHSLAAGFTLPTRNLGKFIQTLSLMAEEELSDKELHPHLDIDAEMSLNKLGNAFELIQQLAPFGSGNPVPSFLSRRVKVVDCRSMGSQGEHLRLKLNQEHVTWDAVAFRQNTTPAEVPPYIDILYSLELDRWNGNENLRLNILDFRPAGTAD